MPLRVIHSEEVRTGTRVSNMSQGGSLPFNLTASIARLMRILSLSPSDQFYTDWVELGENTGPNYSPTMDKGSRAVTLEGRRSIATIFLCRLSISRIN